MRATTSSSRRSPSSSSCAARLPARSPWRWARAHRRVSDAASHEPRGRCHGARDSARGGRRVSALRPQPVRHDRRRPDRRASSSRLLTGFVARTTELKEDAALAAFYLLSLALGVTIVSFKGTNIDLLHVLFGNVLALDDPTLLLIAANATMSLAGAGSDLPAAGHRMRRSRLHALGKPRRRPGAPGLSGAGGGQSCERLSCARHLARGRHHDAAGGDRPVLGARHTAMLLIATASGVVAGYAGLLLSFHAGVASGPADHSRGRRLYLLSLLFGRVGGLLRQLLPGRHLEAERASTAWRRQC